MDNLKHCLKTKHMNSHEMRTAFIELASKISQPAGIGIWNGTIKGEHSGIEHTGDHVAVFTDDALVAAFGPQGDQESEACAALFCLALDYANTLAGAK